MIAELEAYLVRLLLWLNRVGWVACGRRNHSALWSSGGRVASDLRHTRLPEWKGVGAGSAHGHFGLASRLGFDNGSGSLGNRRGRIHSVVSSGDSLHLFHKVGSKSLCLLRDQVVRTIEFVAVVDDELKIIDKIVERSILIALELLLDSAQVHRRGDNSGICGDVERHGVDRPQE